MLPGGSFVVADGNNNVVRKVDTSGTITTIAGTGAAGYTGDGGAATSATLNGPVGIATDAAGDVLIPDYANNVVRKVDTTGIITTFAGNGTGGFAGDGGLAVNAQLSGPVGVLADSAGEVFVSDQLNYRIRKIDSTGTITTVAGGGNAFPGDGGPATAASIRLPYGMSVAPNNSDLLFVDHFGNSVREVSTILPDLLYVTNSVPVSVAFGQQYAYTVTVTNPGGAGTATGVSLTDPLPAGLTFVSAVPSTGSCAFSSGTVSCALGQLPPGSTDTVTITVTAPTTQVPPVSNTVSATANEIDPAPGDNSASATTVVNGADVSITASGSANPVLANAVLTYTLTIQNAGAATATGVVVKDSLPQGITLKLVSTTQGTCGTSGGVVTCQLGSLVAGGTATVTISVALASNVASLIDTATVTADNPDTNPANNTATVNTDVVIGVATQFINPQNTPLYPGHEVSFPAGIAEGSDGNIWFARLFPNFGEYGSMVGRISTNGVYQPAYSNDVSFVNDMIKGPDGNVWFSETGFSGDPQGQSVGRITSDGKVTLFPMPCGQVNCSGRNLTAGADGNIYFTTDIVVNNRAHFGIGRITVKTGVVTFIEDGGVLINDLAAGPDGNVWFSSSNGRQLGRVTPSGTVTWLTTPGACILQHLVTGPDKLLWVTDTCAAVHAYDVSSGQPTLVANFGTLQRAVDIAAGADAVYFTDIGSGPLLIGRATTAGLAYYSTGTGGFVQSITHGPDGNMWFTDFVSGQPAIGRISPLSGPITNPITGGPHGSGTNGDATNGSNLADGSLPLRAHNKPPVVAGTTQCPDDVNPVQGTIFSGDVVVNDNGVSCFLNQVTINGNLHVSAGAFADLSFAKVTGSVTVDTGGEVEIHSSHIQGSVTASGSSFLDVYSSVVDHDLTSNPSNFGVAMICGTSVGGNFTDSASADTTFPSTIGDPRGPIPCAGNRVGGNLTLSGNAEQIIVHGNNVAGSIIVTNNSSTAAFDIRSNNAGSLACSGNAVAPTGGGNKGTKSGQCAGL